MYNRWTVFNHPFFEIASPSDEEAHDIATFGKYVVLNVWGLMTGAFLVGLLALVASGGQILWTLGCALVAYTVLFVICYFMWRAERIKNDQAQLALTQKTDELREIDVSQQNLATKERPLIAGWIKGTSITWWLSEGDEKRKIRGTTLQVNISFTNFHKVDTSIINFAVWVKVGDKNYQAVWAETDSVYADVDKADSERNLARWFQDKSHQAESGRNYEGWLCFNVPDWEHDFKKIPEIKVTVTDAFRYKHEIWEWDNPEGRNFFF